MNRVELLAPAGSYESFLGAIHAGADAVYLGGMKYGARAYAENFDEETLCTAIYYAHLFDRKVYMTLNTLMKQSELEEVEEFLMPFYKAGLDGVIVQDLGLFSFLKRTFPLLELHVSTQMAVTGPKAVKMLKEEGAVRVVPARELSLEEIKLLKAEGLEVETFIHGAMCYCYSGQCFFSSFLGGRSGNRGKCAQSCRLPYQVKLAGEAKERTQKEEYPLSLKDMCSIELVPQLIEAGIDSFKIEGRMKRPEYVAGVTAIYRKYIDKYYLNKGEKFKVSKEDMEILKSLYIRTDIQDGYYKRHNGSQMVTLHKPSYCGIDEKLAESIYDKYVKTMLKARVNGTIVLKKSQPVCLKLRYKEWEVSCEGARVEQAQKRPMMKEDIEKQLYKTGNTDFVFENLNIDMEEDIFIPVKALNELRRQAFEMLEENIKATVCAMREESLRKESYKEELVHNLEGTCETAVCEKIEQNGKQWEKELYTGKKIENERAEKKEIYIQVSTLEQCQKALEIEEVGRLYVSCDLLLLNNKELIQKLVQTGKTKKIWVKLPEVVRAKDLETIEKVLELSGEFAAGMLISNLESYAFLKEYGYTGEISINHHVYVWNQEAIKFWEEKMNSFLMPIECNIHEWKNLQHEKAEYLCYGKIPMMVSANCVRKTKGVCRGRGVSFEDGITDRYRKEFAVQTNCNYCYNVIYNSVPQSLHLQLEQIEKLKGKALRLDFTTENGAEMERILKQYIRYFKEENTDFSFLKDYTTGHYKKGAL